MKPQRITRLSVRALPVRALLAAITPLLVLAGLTGGCARNAAELRLTSL